MMPASCTRPPWLRGHPMARAAVEMATWDLEAKRLGLSLSELLGGLADRVPVGVAIGIQKTDYALFQKVEQYLAEGYRKIKIKTSAGARRGYAASGAGAFSGGAAHGRCELGLQPARGP